MGMFRMAKGFLEVPQTWASEICLLLPKRTLLLLFCDSISMQILVLIAQSLRPALVTSRTQTLRTKPTRPPAPQPTRRPFLPMLNSLGRGLAISRLTWHRKSICHESTERKAELRLCVCFLPLLHAPFPQAFSLLSLLQPALSVLHLLRKRFLLFCSSVNTQAAWEEMANPRKHSEHTQNHVDLPSVLQESEKAAPFRSAIGMERRPWARSQPHMTPWPGALELSTKYTVTRDNPVEDN